MRNRYVTANNSLLHVMYMLSEDHVVIIFEIYAEVKIALNYRFF